MKRLSPLLILAGIPALLMLLPIPKNDAPAQPAPRSTGYIRPAPEVRARHHAEAFRKHSHKQARMAANATPPAKYDEVELGHVPPVLDQGSCGSCYLVSTADAASCAFIKAGYGKNDGSFKISDQFGMDCHNFGGCNGGNGTEVIGWMCKNGFPAERYIDSTGKAISDYPAYQAHSSSCRTKSGAKLWKPADWGFATGDQSDRPPTPAEIKAALMAYGTLNIAFDADNVYSNAGTRVVKITGRNINHETTLVGWDDSKNAWKTRGNWGTNFGDGGYVWMDYSSYLVDVFWISVIPITPPTPPDPGPPPPPPIPPTPPDFPLDVAGDTYTVVRAMPFSVKAPAGFDLYFWSVPVGVSSTDQGAVLQITAAPAGPLTVSLKVISVDWDKKKVVSKFSQTSLVIGGAKAQEASLETTEPPLLDDRQRAIHPECACGDLCACPSCEGRCFQSYDAARERAIALGKPLVVGIACNPPAGDWLTCRVTYGPPWSKDYYADSLAISSPKNGDLYFVGILPARASLDQIRRALNPPQPVQTLRGDPGQTLQRIGTACKN